MKNLDDSIDAKVVVFREGSSHRTAEELLEVFVEDACGLLDVNPQVDSFNEEDRQHALESARSEYEEPTRERRLYRGLERWIRHLQRPYRRRSRIYQPILRRC